MFPEYEVSISEETAEGEQAHGKTLAFDFEHGDFTIRDGRLQPVSNADGLKVWIEKCIRTASQKYLIYRQNDEPYGVDTFNLTDRNYPKEFLHAEIQREITEALLHNPAITGVSSFIFAQELRTLTVSFTVSSIYGDQEVSHKWLIA